MQTFDTNWTTPSVKHHLVPNTYLKGWSMDKINVFFIDKNEKNINFINKDYDEKTRELGRISNFYSRRAGALFRTKEDCDKYFKPIKAHSYTVKIEGKEIKDTLELNDNFYDYDEKWNIYDRRNNELISDELKESLKKEILDIHNRSLEEGWNRLLENNWPNVRQQLLSAVNNETKSLIPAVKRKELIKFMVSLNWRTIPAPKVLLTEYNNILKKLGIKELMDNTIDEEDRMYPFIETFSEEQLHNILLMQYDKFLKNSGGTIFKEYELIYNNMVIELLVAPNGYEFITSDKPVCVYEHKENYTEYLFPIAPELACVVRNGGQEFKTENDKKNYYVLTRLDKDKLFDYNEAIKNNCNKGYILSQKTLKPYFK